MNKALVLSIMLCGTVQAATDQKQTQVLDPALQIVNKKTSLGRYEPNDLVAINDTKIVRTKGLKMSNRIVEDLKRLIAAAKRDGLTLRVVSAYRSYDEQVVTFNKWVQRTMERHPELNRTDAESRTNNFSAYPGHSEHQLGTTVDILSSENNYKFTTNKKFKYIAWLEKNARTFNFKISWPEGNGEFQYEPWHIRWYPVTQQ